MAAPRGPGRDRHGRGVRGPLAWPPVPAMVSRSQRFDDCVLDVIDRLRPRTDGRIDAIDFVVAIAPDLTGRTPAAVPLAESFADGRRRRIVLYRRGIESRARSELHLASLVNRIVVEQVAELLFVDPHDLDEGYDLDEG